MPILELHSGQFAPRTVLLITGLGLIFGLFFSLPPAFGGLAMGIAWMPYGIAVIFAGLLAGFSLAYLVVTFLFQLHCRRKPVVSIHPPSPVLTPIVITITPAPTTIGRRLAEANGVLARLDAEREKRHDAHFGVQEEQRIIWGELLELELQDIDEQVSRICNESRDGA